MSSDIIHSRLEHRNQAKYQDFSNPLLPDFSNVASQISPSEKGYLHWMVSQGYCGKGAIVELGTWLGSSTVHLAQGLKDSEIKGKIHSYDRFIWEGNIHNLKSNLNLEKGADFRPYFEKNIEPFKDIVEVASADFREIVWTGGSIEILFIDAPKNAAGFNATFKAFGKYLMAEDSMVIFQDYLHPPSYDLALCVDQLGEKMDLRHVVFEGGTVGFQVMAQIEPEDYDLGNLNFQKMNIDQVMDSWERILKPLPEPTLHRFTLAQVMHLCDIGATQEACKIFKDLPIIEDAYLRQRWHVWAKIERMREKYGELLDIFYSRLPKSRTTEKK